MSPNQTDHATATGTHYSRQFGVVAGYLPQDRSRLDAWLKVVRQAVAAENTDKPFVRYRKPVRELAHLLKVNGIARMYVTKMIEQVPPEHQTVRDIPELLNTLDYIIRRAPEYPAASHFPMSALFVYMMFTPGGEVAFRLEAFNTAIRRILQYWCKFLDSKRSRYVINKDTGWLSPAAYQSNKLYEFIIPDEKAPDGGFVSFNAYFHRQIKPECRPVSDPGNSKVIVSANDGTVYNIARGVKAADRFWIKSQPYSLVNMLNNHFVQEFSGGDVFQAFLSGADYHRWRSPIDGTIIHTEIVNGFMFSELHSQGFDPDAGVLSQGFEAAVNTRGLVFIQADDPALGIVCVIPIGITEISSVVIEVKNGQKVTKGEELGYFSYGGSTLCLVFQPGVISHFTKAVPPPDSPSPLPDEYTVKVNAQIAVTN